MYFLLYSGIPVPVRDRVWPGTFSQFAESDIQHRGDQRSWQSRNRHTQFPLDHTQFSRDQCSSRILDRHRGRSYSRVHPSQRSPVCNPNAYNGGFTLASIDATGTIIQYENSVSGFPRCRPSEPLRSLRSPSSSTPSEQRRVLGELQRQFGFCAQHFRQCRDQHGARRATSGQSGRDPEPHQALCGKPGGQAKPNSSVSSLNVADLSPNTVTGFTGNKSRLDSGSRRQSESLCAYPG